MIKNLGKFKQWTGEKFGGAKVTLQTEDFQRLEQETEHRREGYDRVLEAVTLVQQFLLKRKTSPEDNRNKVMPFEALGSCLYHYGTVFPDDSALGIALINLGQTETRIAALQEALAQEIKTGYMTTLENGLQEYKEYDTLKKKLTSRRLDYDSKLNRLNKAKKEKPELEQEMQAARIKYEDTEHDLIQKMAYIQEFENEHRDALLDLVEAQCNYHNQAKELFESIKSNWGQGSTSDPRDMMGHVMVARRPSDASFHSHQENYRYSNINSNYTTSIHKQQQRSSPQSSTDDYNTSVDSIHIRPAQQHITSSTTIASSSTTFDYYEKYRKALFDFIGSNGDEINFKAGDVIAVIDEIDKGWWIGEVHGKRGIFPVNYTEEYDPQKHPLPPLPPRSASPVLEGTSEQPPTHQIHDESSYSSLPVMTEPTETTTPASIPPVLPSPSPSCSSSSPVIASIKKSASNSSLTRKRSTAIRPPPPPPAAKSNSTDGGFAHRDSPLHDATVPLVDEPSSYYTQKNTSASSRHGSLLPPAAPPSSRIDGEDVVPTTVSSPIQHTAVPLKNETPCMDCECRDFIENLFKKGYCNNCFHKHE